MPVAIVTEGLTKRFPQKVSLRQAALHPFRRLSGAPLTAVDRVSLEIRQGELFGLLGPNGAGKTTLVKMLCTLVLPDSGRAEVNGFDLSDEARVRASIGLVSGEDRSFYWRLTGRQNLEFFAALHGLSARAAAGRIARAAEWLELGEFLDRRFDRYSSGMKQRLGIARGLLNDPSILFLDEPTRSLDPVSAAHLRDVVKQLVRERGHTVVLVTHQLHEAEDLCDRIAIMHKGRLRVVADPLTLRRQAGVRHYRLRVRGLNAEGAALVKGWPGLAIREPAGDPGLLVLEFQPAEGEAGEALANLLDRVVGAGGRIEDVETPEAALETAFRKFTRDAAPAAEAGS
ncbi:MAG TPA: ABC transporter ATP-binding protein [Kiritimatiellia bacterium]|nr:ABC transporter ATP-binding protein [Kiritimatiellia bacterium]HRZ12418.1 ABC transporter ATP-binding protein [Kiritimatiellia bacterium]HSA17824.1 ABC transporter ATP-binding protein [Kiritimatiellia bacterium]